VIPPSARHHAIAEKAAQVATAPLKRVIWPVRAWRVFGTGIVVGAADDDPSSIATYSQTGAQFGYALGWTLLISYPMVTALQEICARLGWATGKGIAGNLRKRGYRWQLHAAFILLLMANVPTISADLNAMGALLHAILGGPPTAYAALGGVLCSLLAFNVGARSWTRWLKVLSASLFAYLAAALLAGINWKEAALGLVPRVWAGSDWAICLVAVLGTTISPYLFFWQSAEEARQSGQHKTAAPLHDVERAARRIGIDTGAGIGAATIVALAIMLASAATLHGHSAEGGVLKLAEALRPVAGPSALLLFAAGIIGSGLVAIPVFAQSLADVALEGQYFGSERNHGRAYAAVMAMVVLGGVVLSLTPIDPVKALYGSAVANGIAAPPIMMMLLRMASDPSVMGVNTIPARLRIPGWIATAVMTAAVVAMAVAWLW
jgi:Mn2+/Fe2+ NRAMP family transporter